MKIIDEGLKADFLAARTARGLSLRSAAREIGCDVTYLRRMNRDDGACSANLARRIRDWIETGSDINVLADMPNEVWAPVVGFEGAYEVSNEGRVRGVARVIEIAGVPAGLPMRMMTPSKRGKSPHLAVNLSQPGTAQSKNRYVHHRVLEACVGPRPDGAEGCHYDGDPTNNRLSNLRWDSRSGNRSDALRHGTHFNVGEWRAKQRQAQAVRGSGDGLS